MNYLKQVNRFYELQLINSLSANSQSLYFALLNINNKCNWINEFTVANTTLMTFTGLNMSALQRARNVLIQKGYIKYQKRSGNNAGIYEILDFEQQDEQQIEQQSEQQSDNNMNTLNKLNKTKPKIKKESKKEKETELDKILKEKIQDDDLENTLKEFMKMRKAIKRPLTTKGLDLCIEKLFKLSTDKKEQLTILNNSIMNNWQGIFPLKDEQKKQLQQEKEEERKVLEMSEEEYHKRQGGKVYA